MASHLLFATFVALFNLNVCFSHDTLAMNAGVGTDRLQLLFKTMTNDPTEGSSEIFLVLNQQYDIKQIMRRDQEIDPKTQQPYQEVEYYSLNQLKKGMVLKQSNGLAIISLKGESIEPHQGGPIQITYLSNGLKKDYKAEVFSIGRLGNEWQSYSPANEVFHSMLFILKELLGKKIGIKEIKYQTESTLI